ncbi:MAG: helix-turn-helix transcriptional regulator [Salinigranum sp.]
MDSYELTGFQRDLLFVVGGLGAASGKETKRKLEETQDRTLLAGRVYSNLDTLVEYGLVEKGEIDGRTNEYRITDEGREEIRSHYEWQSQHVAPESLSIE